MHGIEVTQHLRQRGAGFLQLLDEMTDGRTRHLPVELADALLRLAPPLRHLVDQAFELLLQRGDHGLGPALLLLGQLLEIRRTHDLALARGRERHAAGRANERDVVRLGLLAQGVEGLFVLLLEAGLDFLTPGAVFLALERRRDGATQILEQPLHVAPQFDAHAGRQLERARLVRLLEVVDVTPVERRGFVRGALLDVAARDDVTAGAGRPEHEQVVAAAADADAEADRLGGARLSEHLGQVWEFRRGLERKLLGVEAPAKRIRIESLHACHRSPFAGAGWERMHARRTLTYLIVAQGQTRKTTNAGAAEKNRASGDLDRDGVARVGDAVVRVHVHQARLEIHQLALLVFGVGADDDDIAPDRPCARRRR